MLNKWSIRLCSVVALTAVAGLCSHARAATMMLVSQGATTTLGTDLTAAEGVVYQSGGEGPLSTLTYTLDTSTDTGSGAYTGTGGTLDFNLSYTSAGVSSNASSEAITGMVTFTGGTLDYNDATGSGTFDFNYLPLVAGATAQSSSSSVSGSVNVPSTSPVPEPASVGVLLLTATGLMRRRRAGR